MDLRARPSRDRRVPARRRRHHSIFNAFVGVCVATLGFAGFSSSALGPAHGTPARAAMGAATLSYEGADPIITGSLGNIFSTGMFAGPNRAEKRNRALPEVNPLDFALGFEQSRLQIAALRAGPSDPAMLPQSQAGVTARAVEEEGPRISVASIGPIAESAALDAIESVSPGLGAPLPLIASEQLAYARADAPVTDFSVVRNAQGKIVSDKELWCMATAIYFEARGESYRGQVAVGQVVMNRIAHRNYPDTMCGVVFQNQHRRNACQFSFACDGIPERVTDRKSWEQAEEIARGVAQGTLYVTEVGAATHYHATYVYPHWAPRMKKLTKVGLHVFYQFKSGWRFG